MNFDDYQELLRCFLDGSMSSEKFQDQYLEKFKREARNLPENAFHVLDALFADVDAFCPDPAQLVQLNRAKPAYYLGEHALRQRVSEASEQLKTIAAPTNARSYDRS